MAEFKDLPGDFCCPYRDGCPYLEGLSTGWVWQERQDNAFLVGEYEYQLEQLNAQLDEQRKRSQELERQNQQLQAQLHALHRRQFKARKSPATPVRDCPSAQRKKRGAPAGHPPWQRRKPKHIDQTIEVPAPQHCPHCQSSGLEPVGQIHEHLQEDILLQPRTVVTLFPAWIGLLPRLRTQCVAVRPGANARRLHRSGSQGHDHLLALPIECSAAQDQPVFQ
jgi:hypothetical protein